MCRGIKYREEAILKQQHIQATQELSGGKSTISNRAKGINISKDVPKK